MLHGLPILLAQGPLPWLVGAAVVFVIGVIIAVVLYKYAKIWFRAYMSSANISLLSLIGMSLRRVNANVIVLGKIMAVQAGIGAEKQTGISTRRLEAHYLAGGSVPNVIKAIIAAHRADIDLDFDRAAAIDLAGRDVLDAVQTSVYPKVIDCPDPKRSQRTTLERHRQERRRVQGPRRVTVRTNIEQLIGGATEETIIARVGEGIITAIGSSDSHLQVMENPDRISKAVLERGLDAQTAFEIVSIDIADIDVGQNIGARLQADQAEADTRVARAKAEERRALATAREQEMKAQVARNRAGWCLAEAEVPLAMAAAFREGNLAGKVEDCDLVKTTARPAQDWRNRKRISGRRCDTDHLTHCQLTTDYFQLPQTTSHVHRRLFALSRRHGQEDQVLLRRFPARIAKDRPHDRRRAVPGLPAARRPAAGPGAGPRSGVPAGHASACCCRPDRPARGRREPPPPPSWPNIRTIRSPWPRSAIARGPTNARAALDLLQRAMRAADGSWSAAPIRRWV